MVVQFKRFLFLLFIGLNAIGQIKGKYVDTRDNKEYTIITIGEQTWFAENVAFEINKGSWVYEKKAENLAIYGRLYNWKSACEVCPNGWRLPSLDDYKTLLKNINVPDSLFYYETLVDGGKSSFNVKLAGWYARRKYGQLNIHTDFWTSTIYQPFKGATKNAYRFSFYKKDKQVYWNPDYTDYGFSVRCIKE
jgi:uncharacterized protein (TIGR02145 family)